MSAYEYSTVAGALIDRIWTTDERATNDELVNIGVKLINGLTINLNERGKWKLRIPTSTQWHSRRCRFMDVFEWPE